jgi:hypothetical protein
VGELRALAAQPHALPPVLCFHQGSVVEGRLFFDRFWPEARAVSDGDRVFYQALGLERGGVRQILGPAIWGPGLRALMGGTAIGWPRGDPWQLSGFFLVKGERIVWSHRSRHSADLPEFARLAGILREAVAGS